MMFGLNRRRRQGASTVRLHHPTLANRRGGFAVGGPGRANLRLVRKSLGHRRADAHVPR